MRVCGQSAFQKQRNSVQIRRGLQRFHSKNRESVEHRRWMPVIAPRRRTAASWSLLQRTAKSRQKSQFRVVPCNVDRSLFQKNRLPASTSPSPPR